MTKSARPRRGKSLGEVSLRVRDLDATHKFYEEVVGLDVLRREMILCSSKSQRASVLLGEIFVPCACVHLCI